MKDIDKLIEKLGGCKVRWEEDYIDHDISTQCVGSWLQITGSLRFPVADPSWYARVQQPLSAKHPGDWIFREKARSKIHVTRHNEAALRRELKVEILERLLVSLSRNIGWYFLKLQKEHAGASSLE